VRCTTSPGVGVTVQCYTLLYLMYEDFAHQADEGDGAAMDAAYFGALSKSLARGYASAWFDAEEYYDGSTYYHVLGNAKELSSNNPQKFGRQCTIEGQTVYGVYLAPGVFNVNTQSGNYHSASLTYVFYQSGIPHADPSNVAFYLVDPTAL